MEKPFLTDRYVLFNICANDLQSFISLCSLYWRCDPVRKLDSDKYGFYWPHPSFQLCVFACRLSLKLKERLGLNFPVQAKINVLSLSRHPADSAWTGVFVHMHAILQRVENWTLETNILPLIPWEVAAPIFGSSYRFSTGHILYNKWTKFDLILYWVHREILNTLFIHWDLTLIQFLNSV